MWKWIDKNEADLRTGWPENILVRNHLQTGVGTVHVLPWFSFHFGKKQGMSLTANVQQIRVKNNEPRRIAQPPTKMSALRLSQTHHSHGLLRTVFLVSVCFFFASSSMGFCFSVGSLAESVVTKKPQSNQGRTFILASQELLQLLHARTVMGHFSAGALLEAGAGVIGHMRDKAQRTPSNAACTGVYTQMRCGSACSLSLSTACADPEGNQRWDGSKQCQWRPKAVFSCRLMAIEKELPTWQKLGNSTHWNKEKRKISSVEIAVNCICYHI